jgi:protein-S-isoprenylcysteine O-methyltransferase Ste14
MERWTVWRMALIVLLSSLTAIRFHYKLKYHAFRFSPVSRAEGLLPGAIRVALGLPMAWAAVAACFFPAAFPWMSISVPTALRSVGCAVAITALCALVWVHRYLGPGFSTSVEPGRSSTLVTGGPYRLVRHPMYSAYLLYFVSLLGVSGNWVLGVSGAGVIVSMMVLRVPREDRILRKRYGPAYEAYADTIPKFVPSPRSLYRILLPQRW